MNEFYSVGYIVNQIKSSLESDFKNLLIEGEVTNLSCSGSGHWYFSLRDKDALLGAALFKMDAYRNPLIKSIQDGDKIRCHGNISVYQKRGNFQLIVRRILPIGKGELKEQFENLKRKLSSEGLFDLEHKKLIPELPKRVAIITAEGGAALQDFLNIQKRKSLWMDTVLIPTVVQGEHAPRSIRSALHRAIKYSLDNPLKKFDIIVLTRGGGSLEDLWAFNDEGLAYDIFNCPIPVISAVGHQVDFSISDFVADKRVETPSAAAEILTVKQEQLLVRMENVKKNLLTQSHFFYNKNLMRLKDLGPKVILEILYDNIMTLQRKLQKLNPIEKKYEYTGVHELNMTVDDLYYRMKNLLSNFLVAPKNKLEKNHLKLIMMNPKGILKRGYAYIEDENNHIVKDLKSFDEIKASKSLVINFHDGQGIVKK